MLDKTKLGNRFTCFACGTKFYDLNRPAAKCPECDVDQEDAPVRDLRDLLGRGRTTRPVPAPAPVATPSDDNEDDQTEAEAEEDEEESEPEEL